MRLQEEQVETVVSTGSLVPGTNEAVFSNLHLSKLLESGSVAVKAVLEDETASGLETGRLSNWIFLIVSDPQLVSLIEETVPPDFTTQLTLIAHVPFIHSVSDDFSVALVKTGEGVVMLAGAPHQGQPYPDIGAPDATSLKFIASTSAESPSGFANTTFYRQFRIPSIDTQGRVFFGAVIGDALDPDIKVTGIFQATTSQPPRLLFKTGDSVLVDGAATVISELLINDAQLLSAILIDEFHLPVSHTQGGGLIVPVRLEGNRGGAILYVQALP